ncbi:unnamed protein product [Medioppia subpectinata]|uniref:EGF domain-specific O-linked N-acetylglucosamine transferase n=1 Tax=Medioppia subpectinata TaxID=1979941 RepID=A0A7R9KCL1_9ACAR|nr:unnamed protein product [Medioppia subpectinata]CAG2100159.1 unnamed protein product [Medioppia subpectinata]
MSNQLNDNYYGFDANTNHSLVSNTNAMAAPMGPQSQPKQVHNYGHRNAVNANRRPNGHNVNNETHNSYYRRNQPYFGHNRTPGPAANQYRAQVIDYSNGTQSQPIRQYNPQNATANNYCQPMSTRPQTGLLPTPNHNQQPYGQPSQHQSYMPNANRAPAPTPNQPYHPSSSLTALQRPQQMNSYAFNNQSVPQYPIPTTYSQMSQPVPQPVPPPTVPQMVPPVAVPMPVPPPSRAPLFPLPVPPVTAQQQVNQMSGNNILVNIKVESDIESQRKSEETRSQKLLSEGMDKRTQNELNGFYCLFCEVFCNNLNAAERHVETPKHHRTKIGDNFKGIDAKFTIKSERISETRVALARKGELNKISNVIKNEYFNEGIRLKDGIGPNAYVCENCDISIASLALISEHLELHKQLAEQLRMCSKPVIGLDFICEYIDPNPSKARLYECTLCRTFTTSGEVITHVCGYAHRTNFIKRIHPKEGNKFTVETKELSLEAAKQAFELELVVGRGQYKVKHQPVPQHYAIGSGSLDQIACNYSYVQTPSPSPGPPKPVIQIELPEVKSDDQKSPLEKLFCVRLESESDANVVTKMIETITNCVFDYITKDMLPETREQNEYQLLKSLCERQDLDSFTIETLDSNKTHINVNDIQLKKKEICSEVNAGLGAECWGYERDCDESHVYLRPECPEETNGWARNELEAIKVFWDSADFGYVSQRNAEMKYFCRPKTRTNGKQLISSLKCSQYMRYCSAKNILIDFEMLSKMEEPVRYRDDVLRGEHIGGWNCDLLERDLKSEGQHKSPLQSWFAEIENFRVLSDDEECDQWVEKPTFIMKLDATVNMYHHFCDFINLYASLHLNNSFSTDNNIVVWDSYPYRSNFGVVWNAFTRNPVLNIGQFKGKKVCFRDLILPLLPRMIFGIYYNMPLIPGCRQSGLFRAFNRHLIHRLGIEAVVPQNDNLVRITMISRRTKYRQIVNEAELMAEIQALPDVSVEIHDFNHWMSFDKQMTISANSDVLIGIHGAGLTHALFQPDWAVLMELYNCDDEHCYKDLSRLRGVRYMTWTDRSKVYPQESNYKSENPQFSADAKFTNYRFDAKEFKRLVTIAVNYVRKTRPSMIDKTVANPVIKQQIKTEL